MGKCAIRWCVSLGIFSNINKDISYKQMREGGGGAGGEGGGGVVFLA